MSKHFCEKPKPHILAILIQKESQRYYYQWRWKNHFWREKQLNYCQVFNTSFSKFVSNLNQPSIHNLSIRKKSQTTYFQSKMIKLNSDISSKFVYKHLNNCIDRGKFPNELKHYELVPVHKETVNLTIKTLDL